MFIGKSVLASFLLSTVVVSSGINGGQVAGGQTDTSAATVQITEVSPIPESLQDSGASGQGKTAQGPESIRKTRPAEAPEGVQGGEASGESQEGMAEAVKAREEESQESSGQEQSSQEETQGQQDAQEESRGEQSTEQNSQELSEEEEQQEEVSEESGEQGESQVPLLEGTSLAMLASRGGAQMLSTVIRSDEGRLVVVDGGWQADGDYLMETIRANGGVVDAWLITHPHSDHAGALYHILKHYGDEIEIKKIYYSFAPVSWYEEADSRESDLVVRLTEEFEKLPEEMLCGTIGKGQKITVDNLRITVVNDRYDLEEDPVNNSSIVYRVDAGRKSILFLGDMSYAAGSLLVRDGGSNLDADIVQMAHHGQNGVGHSVYSIISPKICLWPTPQWLWDNDNGGGYNSGPWQTILTRNFIDSMKVREQYCTKDGDIVLSLN